MSNAPVSLLPRQAVPDLTLETVDGPVWQLSNQKPENFTLIVFYRGLHCPICGKYLKDLDTKISDFEAKGVNVVAVSSDTEERAAQAKKNWKIENLTIGHSLTLDDARDWGLFISAGIGKTSIGIEEPGLFSEPGLFLVRPDGTLYFGTVQTMPFARPNFAEILGALDFVIAKGYPARGEISDHKAQAAA
ncbi:MAG: peroxiredoxin-like family protein [Magnetovibrionaceae bacterium]